MTTLCDFPTDQGAGCCSPAPKPPAAPFRPSNAPNLEQVAYRIGAFGSFRRAMQDRLAEILPGWRQSESGQDYATVFIELWAYIADVLTFYQERIANEAYLGTATRRDSLLRLAQLVDYRAGPGAAAAALLSFKLGKDKIATVPVGLRVSSKPSAGHPAAIFETDAAIHATAAHNSVPIAKLACANQFVTLDQNVQKLLAGKTPDDMAAALSAVFPAYAHVLKPGAGVASSATLPLGGGGGEWPIRAVTFEGLNLRLRPGDWLLIMADSHVMRQISTSTADPAAKTTTVTWQEPPGYTYMSTWIKDPDVYAFRAEALPFGHDAPIPPTLADERAAIAKQLQDQVDTQKIAWQSWGKADLPTGKKTEPLTMLAGAGLVLPEDFNDQTVLHLDRAYDGVAPSAGSSRSMIVLLSPGPDSAFVTDVTAVAKVTHDNYGLRARVTELKLKETIPTRSTRDTTVLVRSEPLSLFNTRPLPDPVDGPVLLLDGLFPRLAPGQRVIVQGTRLDTEAVDAEDGMIESIATDEATRTTSVFLHAPLANQYHRTGAVLMANVAPASQGEKVKDEVLGSGDGSAWQTHTLRKSPLTYVQAPAQATEAAVVSTLEVIVGGVMWSERPNLLDAGPADRVFLTSEDAAGKTSVMFGDGSSGVRPATGKDNIHARYRKGLGQSGNVDVGAIAQLVGSVPGVQSVTNPEPAIGGADPESEAQIRTNAPAKLRTFNRAVAIDDFASVALNFPGVAMATAEWQRNTPAAAAIGAPPSRPLLQPKIRLTIGTANGKTLASQGDYAARLRHYLDARRDVNVPMVLLDYDAVYIDFAATIDVDDAYGRQATLRAAIAAMNYRANPDGGPAFFASFGFGEAVHLSAVYAALQTVPGVRAATVTKLRQSDGADPAAVWSSIPVGPSGRAVILNDGKNGNFVLTLGIGGFAD